MRHFMIYLFALSLTTSGVVAQKSVPLYSLEKKHSFSSVSKEDIFKLTVVGKNIFDSFVTFQITDWSGRIIFQDRFSMNDLCERGDSDSRDKEAEQSIYDQLSYFFDEERFNNPAIKDTVEMQSNSFPREVWFDIWQDRSAIGFNYQLGAEDGRGIVYSKKKKKVIQYYACC
jgi:hypothetical protein